MDDDANVPSYQFKKLSVFFTKYIGIANRVC